KLTKVKMLPLKPPSTAQVQKELISHAVSEIELKASSNGLNGYKEEAKKLINEIDPIILASLLLQSYTKSNVKNRPVNISTERPLPLKKRGSRRRNKSDRRSFHRSKTHKNNNYDFKKNHSSKKNNYQNSSSKKIKRNFVIRTNV
ncbi:MAG: hypothetical protein ACRCZW_12945, partial [Lactobacillaceae bacterium]